LAARGTLSALLCLRTAREGVPDSFLPLLNSAASERHCFEAEVQWISSINSSVGIKLKSRLAVSTRMKADAADAELANVDWAYHYQPLRT
jgi:hypothetical protein